MTATVDFLLGPESEDRKLFKKYIRYIIKHEGTDFLDEHCDDPDLFTTEDWEALIQIRDEIIAENSE